MPKSDVISALIAAAMLLTLWGGWAIASAWTLARQGFFSARPLLRAPQRYSQFTLLEPAAIVIVYMGLIFVGTNVLRGWIIGSPSAAAVTASAPASSSAPASTSAPATTAATAPATRPSLMTMTPDQLARMQLLDSAVKLLLVGAMLLLAKRLMVEGMPGLGLSPRQFFPGVLAGLHALWLLVPWLLMTMIGVGLIRKLFTDNPPFEHPILKALHDNPGSWATIVLIASEAILAPIAEELLFRGLLQTALLRMGRQFEARARGFEPVFPGQTGYANSKVPTPEAVSARWRWTTILAVSACFASVHFMGNNPEVLPTIFLLAVGLGYLYERTGNLWACMTLHFAFNATSTLLNQIGSK